MAKFTHYHAVIADYFRGLDAPPNVLFVRRAFDDAMRLALSEARRIAGHDRPDKERHEQDKPPHLYGDIFDYHGRVGSPPGYLVKRGDKDEVLILVQSVILSGAKSAENQ